ncbi:Ankyrin repeat and fibronectin type-III domain-containing protein 1 [Pseudolycoriella hygida]|uniref:Ankyrin repeat and fibronectin type-III domain-containing protein 1 n=1 Tax=Pseudolycoriella hygida TaxID=35572 RepID=A0A9Q0RXL3_9DIPT|nr:Ankyrin repeat and fibronectin type-III domain-containing protein 1 [Pseudolycoriella hygida]
MILNFKSLRRSFSLKNNVSEDKEDKNVTNLLKESVLFNKSPKIDTDLDVPPNKINFYPSPTDLQKTNFEETMEYLMPYTRLKPKATTGMQLTSVRKTDRESSSETLTRSSSVVNGKQIQKSVINQQFTNLTGSSEVEFSSTKLSKKQLKLAQDQLQKLSKINIHLHALFSAVENGQSDKAKSILESTDVNVNCINSDALSPLDVAVLTNNRFLTKVLLQHGANHGARFKNCESIGKHINSLLEDALNKINDFTCGRSDDEQDADKEIDFWQRRATSLQRILRGWVQTTVPNFPNSVVVDVTSSTSVAIKVQESVSGAITTKFKIQWSFTADFDDIIDEREINDLTNNQGVMTSTLHLYNLIHGRRYYFRALSGNIKGWSEKSMLSTPSSVIPSSWRDIGQRTVDNKQTMDSLIERFRKFRRMTSMEIHLDVPSLNGLCIKKKATIRQLFTATSKFQKHFKRGIYLASLLYHDGKVLVTNDDLLPVIEIDENYPKNVLSEIPFFMKISCNWDIVKALRNETEKYSSTGNQFRIKFLSALCQMQSIMGIKDLGCFYFKPLQDSEGTIVISCVNSIKNPKSISVLNSRWISLKKIQRKLLPINDGSSMNEIILASISHQIDFHEALSVKLSKGLYVGYLKMHCSMEQMHVVVPAKTPHALPHSKVRDNPHVCAEEWSALQETFDEKQKTEMQKRFLDALSSAAIRVCKYMGLSTECMLKHKLYNMELVKLSHDVSFLIICPPIELSCAPPGQREKLLQRTDLVSVPTPAFEMGQLFIYDPENTRKCSRLAIIMHLEDAEANSSHREAFSTVEAQAAKERLNELEEIKNDLGEYWKNIRWLLNVMTFTRNRCTDTGVSMRSILTIESSQTDSVEKKNDKRLTSSLCDANFIRRSPCRLSWPNTNRKEQPPTEMSKSDQQLNFVMSRVNFGKTMNVDSSRRNSADACPKSMQASEESLNSFVDRFALCKSDETLSSSKPLSPVLQRKRSKTINARICSSKCMQCGNSPTSKHVDHVDKVENKTSNAPNNSDEEVCQKAKIESTDKTDKEHLHKVDDNVIELTFFGTIQVYIENEKDSADGIRLRLHITSQTTAREIIDLVVNQCNQTDLRSDGKAYNQMVSKDFCLFAIFGNVGRCVPDNFRPLQLQNPWTKGRLYVRRTRDILDEMGRSQQLAHSI